MKLTELLSLKVNRQIKDVNPTNVETTAITVGSGFSVASSTNRLVVKNRRAVLDFKVSTASLTAGTEYTIGTFLAAYNPALPFITTAMQSVDGWGLGGMVYCYIGGGQIKVKITDATKGNYITLHSVWDI